MDYNCTQKESIVRDPELLVNSLSSLCRVSCNEIVGDINS